MAVAMTKPWKSLKIGEGCARPEFVGMQHAGGQDEIGGVESLFNETAFCQKNALLLSLQA